MPGPPKTSPPKAAAKAAPKSPKPGGRTPARQTKSFSVAPWNPGETGTRLIVYGKSGIGKSSLAALAPEPVFVGLDDGGCRLTTPDGNPIQHVEGVITFQDFLDLLDQPAVFEGYKTIVVDNLTKLEELGEDYVVQNYNTSKGGRAKNFRAFGWDGPPHMLDAFRKVLNACDRLASKGFTLMLLAQVGHKTVENPDGADYLEAGPSLIHQRHCSVRDQVCQWADIVARIAYLDSAVEVAEGAKAGKVVSNDATRAVYTGGAQHFIAKTRPVGGLHIPAVLSFESPTDDSFWQALDDPSQFTETEDDE